MEGGQEAGPHQASSGVRKDRLSISLFPRTRGARGRILSERKESPESHSGIAALALLWAQGRRKRGCQKQRNGLEAWFIQAQAQEVVAWAGLRQVGVCRMLRRTGWGGGPSTSWINLMDDTAPFPVHGPSSTKVRETSRNLSGPWLSIA